MLTVYDHADNDAVLRAAKVGLAYAAVFGPNVAGVEKWKALAVQAVDDHAS